ncbi:MAG: hypothetical protein U5K72_01885 [Balneolaceae bacterium]|nr:hypothetical protein [Balneolaceae bacterium]
MKNQSNSRKIWKKPELKTLSISRDTAQGPDPQNPPEAGQQS